MKKSIESRLIEGWTEDSPMFTENVPPVQSYADPVYGRDDSQRYDPSLQKGVSKISEALGEATADLFVERPTIPGEYAADRIARVAFPAINYAGIGMDLYRNIGDSNLSEYHPTSYLYDQIVDLFSLDLPTDAAKTTTGYDESPYGIYRGGFGGGK